MKKPYANDADVKTAARIRSKFEGLLKRAQAMEHAEWSNMTAGEKETLLRVIVALQAAAGGGE